MNGRYKKARDGRYIKIEKKGRFTEEVEISKDEYDDTKAITNVVSGIIYLTLFFIFMKSCMF